MKVAFSEQQIRRATARLAEEINRDYRRRHVHFIGVLKGSFVFLADLIRQVRVPCSVDFVRLSSYGAGTRTSGRVDEVLSLRDCVRGRHLIVVEEIVDTGTTLAKLLGDLKGRQPASLEVCTLVDKTGRREAEVPVRYRGLVIEEGFLVGYGLDLDERYRNLPAIHVLDPRDGEPVPAPGV